MEVPFLTSVLEYRSKRPCMLSFLGTTEFTMFRARLNKTLRPLSLTLANCHIKGIEYCSADARKGRARTNHIISTMYSQFASLICSKV